jgi:hypothetical protein
MLSCFHCAGIVLALCIVHLQEGFLRQKDPLFITSLCGTLTKEDMHASDVINTTLGIFNGILGTQGDWQTVRCKQYCWHRTVFQRLLAI